MPLSADGLSEGTRKKKETEMHIWHVPSQPSNWQVFLDEREEPTHSSMGHHSLGHGASGRRPLGPEGLLSQSIKHFLYGRGRPEMGTELPKFHCGSSELQCSN